MLLPTFGTRDMVNKSESSGGRVKRKISKDTARNMLMWSHYKFKLRLLDKARQWGKTVVVVSEAYTSKTCTRCGWQNETLGKSKIFNCKQCGLVADRDLNAARNILIRNAAAAA